MANRFQQRHWQRGGLALVALAAALSLSGCAGISSLRFTADHRVRLQSPKVGETVTLPFKIRWSARDLPAPDGHPARVAVFLDDQQPMAPGKAFKSLISNDPVCTASPDCPDPDYLRERLHVLMGEGGEATVSSLPGALSEKPQAHTITLILVDSHGQRIGDSNWFASFTVAQDLK